MTAKPASDTPMLRERVALIGDVHGEDAALQAILSFLADLGPLDAILCTGDIPGRAGVGNTGRCCALLDAAGAFTIRGNHDRWFFEKTGKRFGDDTGPLAPAELTFLRRLPTTRSFDTPHGALLLCHGVATDDMSGIYPGGDDDMIDRVLESYGLPGDYALMIAGHTHRRMVRPLPSGMLLLNPGTLRWDEEPGFGVLDLEAGVLQFYDLTPIINTIQPGERHTLPMHLTPTTEHPQRGQRNHA